MAGEPRWHPQAWSIGKQSRSIRKCGIWRNRWSEGTKENRIRREWRPRVGAGACWNPCGAPVPGHQTLGCVALTSRSLHALGGELPGTLALLEGGCFRSFDLGPAKWSVLTVEGVGLHPKTKGIRHHRAGLVSWPRGCPSRDTGTSGVGFTPKVLPSG